MGALKDKECGLASQIYDKREVIELLYSHLRGKKLERRDRERVKALYDECGAIVLKCVSQPNSGRRKRQKVMEEGIKRLDEIAGILTRIKKFKVSGSIEVGSF